MLKLDPSCIPLQLGKTSLASLTDYASAGSFFGRFDDASHIP
jgi:hypothetical protein